MRPVELPDGRLEYEPAFLSAEESAALFVQLEAEIPWRADEIMVFGRRVMQPRLTAWFAEDGIEYRYSGTTFPGLPFPEALWRLKERCHEATDSAFNSALVNYYRDGRDSMGRHSDDEKSLGPEPVIASVSLGAERDFVLRHRRRKELPPRRVTLASGSLLVMSGPTQRFWHHEIPKRRNVNEGRINVTFRCMLAGC